MTKTLSAILLGFIFSNVMGGNIEPQIFELATITFKDGKKRQVIWEITDPSSMQKEIVCFDPSAIKKPWSELTRKEKERISPVDVISVKTSKKFYEVRKFANMLSAAGANSLPRLYFIEVLISGKITLYNFYDEGITTPAILIGKKDDPKLKPVSATSLMKYIEDATQIKEKFLAGAYGNNPKNDNAIINDNLSFIHKLVKDYNEFSAYGRFLTEEEIAQRNRLMNTIIFDFYINFELSERNGNLNALIDYVPRFENSNVKSVEMTSNYGFEKEKSSFIYGDKKLLQKIVYQKEDKQYVYDFVYENSLPSYVNVGGVKRISFIFLNDTLRSIIREFNKKSIEVALNYSINEKKVEFDLAFLSENKVEKSTRRSNLSWTDNYLLEGIDFDRYLISEIQYTDSQKIESFKVSNTESQGTIKWEYSNDTSNNWIERKSGENIANRSIQYASN